MAEPKGTPRTRKVVAPAQGHGYGARLRIMVGFPPDEYRELAAEAWQAGVSLAEYLRILVAVGRGERRAAD